MARVYHAQNSHGSRRRLYTGVGVLVIISLALYTISGSRTSSPTSEPVYQLHEEVMEPDEPPPEPKLHVVQEVLPKIMPICQSKHSEGKYDNLHMSTEVCDGEFGPLLWQEIDHAAAHYKQVGGITAEDAEEAEEGATIRLKGLNGQLYIKKYAWAPASRALAAVHAVYRALITSPEAMPDFDLSISLDDAGPPAAARWVLDRQDSAVGVAWLTPDFGLWSWPEPWVGGWRDFRCRVSEVERHLKWDDKIDKLFWRGVPMSPNRRELIDMASQHAWGDVLTIDWGSPENAEGQRIPMQDHCKYRYLAQAEGFAYSGRLKYLLMCSSVIVSHQMQYTQHFHSLFNSDPASPHQNIVVLEHGNWTGLEEAMDDLRSDQRRAEGIAQNSRKTFMKYLSPAAEVCYWRRALRAYAALQEGQVPQSLDGWLDYESFSLARSMEWAPH